MSAYAGMVRFTHPQAHSLCISMLWCCHDITVKTGCRKGAAEQGRLAGGPSTFLSVANYGSVMGHPARSEDRVKHVGDYPASGGVTQVSEKQMYLHACLHMSIPILHQTYRMM